MINPIAFQLGPISVHWYGLLYGVGLFVGLWMLTRLNQKRPAFKNNDQWFDLLFWVFLLGVVLGGRLGYVLFYNLPFYLEHPAKILAVWEGGMSFHGGLLGTALVTYLYTKRHHVRFLDVADLMVIPGALAQAMGRVGNFINGELMGRVITNDNWLWLGVDFGDGALRYPSSLFQASALFLSFLVLLSIFHQRPKRHGILLASYLMLNGGFRLITECFRSPDAQIGFLFGTITLGQVLSMAVFMIGLVGLFVSKAD